MSRLKKLKESKLSKLLPEGSRQRGGVQLKHTASRRYRVFSFEKGESCGSFPGARQHRRRRPRAPCTRSEEHTSELQSQSNLVCRLLLEKKKNTQTNVSHH